MEEVQRRSSIDPWFLGNLQELVELERTLRAASAGEREAWLRRAKQAGFSDRRLAALWNLAEDEVRALRHRLGIRPVYKRVDTCGAEFEAFTPYLYSTYEDECEARPTARRNAKHGCAAPSRPASPTADWPPCGT